jgi:hypothetical protein
MVPGRDPLLLTFASENTRSISMRRLSLRQTVLSIAALGAATGGCADNDSALFIRSVIALEPGDCVATNQPEATSLAFGMYDLGLAEGRSYFAFLLVGNQLSRQGDRDKVRTETSRIALRGADVEVRTVEGATITSFATDGAGFADPGTATDPGYGIMPAELLPAGAAAGLDRVNVSVRVVGETLGGTEIRSSELIFPINICQGCTVSFPADAVDPATGLCAGEPPGDPACILGQDAPTDCRHCAGSGNPCCENRQQVNCQ